MALAAYSSLAQSGMIDHPIENNPDGYVAGGLSNASRNLRHFSNCGTLGAFLKLGERVMWRTLYAL
jgi:hypothetical protein